MQHYQITVSGKVQGVWFRQSTREKARELGLTGFVRNESDGSVYIEASGPADALAEFMAWCHQGPPMAHVENVSAHPFSPEQASDEFNIQH